MLTYYFEEICLKGDKNVKCIYCDEELGFNNVCINPTCSYFGTEINILNNSNLNHNKNELQDDPNIKNINNSSHNTKINYSEMNSNSPNERTSKSVNTYFMPSNGGNNISKEEFDAFIGSNSSYYLKYTTKLENNNRFLSWNWPCFFLSWYWLLYRKLYVPAIILIGVNFASSRLLERKIYLFTMFIIRILLAIFANNIYLNNCKSKIRTIKATLTSLTNAEYIRNLRKKGGVTLTAPIILLILSILGAIIYIIVWFAHASRVPNYSGSYYL
jgi:hypothetical protein